jgi:Zn ribbon nucleic-acid-binding protein
MRARGSEEQDMTVDTLTCLDNGPKHAWEGKGLDIWRGKLVSVRACVWCGKEKHQAPRPHPQRTYSHP